MPRHILLISFKERNSDLSVRHTEGLSVAQAQGMKHADVNNYFKMLEEILVENDLL
jgi:hypothetical protein